MTSKWETALRTIGSTSLSLALLLAGSGLMLVGSIYAGDKNSLIGQLNETRLQDFLAISLWSNLSTLWWLPLLLTVLFLLGLNGASCALLRIRELWGARRTIPPRALLTASCPSLVHVAFLIVLLGHGVTFAFGDWRRVDLDGPGFLGQAPMPLSVVHLDHEIVAEDSAVARQASRTAVTLEDALQQQHEVRYMHPATVADYDILLDEKKNRDGEGTLQLFFVRDPGIVLIVPAFLAVLALMTWYYWETSRVARRRAKRYSTVNRTPSQPAMPRSG
jgi:hypothetical protein